MLVDVAEWRLDILQEHLEELEALCNRRLGAPRSPALEAVGLKRCDARIEAHTDALLLAEEHAWPLVARALTSDEPAAAAAAAMVIASAADAERERRLVEVFSTAGAETRAALRAVLELRAGPGLRAALRALTELAAPVEASVWMVAAAHGEKTVPPRRAHWIDDESSEVRRLFWRAEARVAADAAPHQRGGLSQSDYLRAFADPDREVRRSALEAAARTSQPWLLERLRSTATVPAARAIDEHLLLAALGGPNDTSSLLAIGRSQEIGWYRSSVLGTCGRLPAVEELLRIMREGPAVEAALAGLAFFRITGVDVHRPGRIPLIPPDAEPDELDEEIKSCDVERAEHAWQALRGRMGRARWVRGVDAESLAVNQLPLTLDLETRWNLQLRAAFERSSASLVFDAERFPFE